MCTLNRAFPGSNLMAVMYSIVEGEKPQLPATFTAGLRNLFDRMLEKDPCQRPSAVAILQDPFLQRKLEVCTILNTVFVYCCCLCHRVCVESCLLT